MSAIDVGGVADPPAAADHRRGGIGDVNGQGNATFSETHGPVNTGTGPQYNGPVHFAPASVDSRSPSRRPVSVDRLRWLAKRFVPPGNPGYLAARLRLQEPGAVVISGAVGSGRRTAALMLLERSGHGTSAFQELSVQPNGKLDPPADTIQDGERLLLDLSGFDPARLPDVEHVLAPFRAEVEHRAYLAVVLPIGYERILSDEFYSSVVGIERPDGRAVLLRHFECDEIPLSADDLRGPSLTPHLKTASMSELARLARLTAAARERADNQGQAQAWLQSALSGLSDQSAEAAKQIGADDDGWRKSWVLTSAMLDGAPADAVFDAQRRLVRALDYPPAEAHTLDGDDLAASLAKIGVERDRRRVRFPKLGFDHALRTHFWVNFPGLRNSFRDWVIDVAESVPLPEADRALLIERFVDQALGVDRTADVFTVASRWTEGASRWTEEDGRWTEGEGPGRGSLAELLLQKGLEHERHAQAFRQKFYEWARNTRLPLSLAEALIALSESVIALTHATEAVVRLHHLTRHTAPSVRSSATKALMRLSREPRFWRRVLHRLCGNPAFLEMRSHDRGLFLALIDPAVLVDTHDHPHAIIDNRQVRHQLTIGWRTVLTYPHGQPVDESIHKWLSACAANPKLSTMLDALVDATDSAPAVLGRLYAISREWVHRATETDPSARRRTAEHLRARIDHVQGLDFLTPKPNPMETDR